MQAVKRVSAFEATVDALQAEIASGRWPVGSQIPSEATLTKQLGVSRASLREAIRSLVHAGLLQSKQGAGTYVLSDNATDAALRRHLSAAPTGDVAEVRRGLDVVATRLAATRRTEEDLEALEDALAARSMAATAGDESGFVAADVAFHIAIAVAARNSVLVDIYASFVHTLEMVIRGGHCMATSLSGRDPYHDQILEALRRRDPAAATLATEALLDLNASN